MALSALSIQFSRDQKLDLLEKVISEVPIRVSVLLIEWEKGRNRLSEFGLDF